MESGKRKMKNVKWRAESEEQRLKNEKIKWEIENGKLIFLFLD